MCVKQVVDVTQHIALDVVTNRMPDGLNYVVNPSDLNATEEALRLKSQFQGEVIVLSAGSSRADATLRECLSMGADRAVRVWHPTLEKGEGFVTAQVLAWAIARLSPDIILCGSRSMDEGTSQVPAALADVLGLPQVTSVTFIEVSPSQGKLIAHRKLERGNRNVVECQLPAVVSVEPSINIPRYPTTRSRLWARKEPILEMDTQAMGMPEPACAMQFVRLSPPRPRPKMTSTVDISLSAEERMRQIISGGIHEKKGALWEGTPEELAVRLVQYLAEKGLLSNVGV